MAIKRKLGISGAALVVAIGFLRMELQHRNDRKTQEALSAGIQNLETKLEKNIYGYSRGRDTYLVGKKTEEIEKNLTALQKQIGELVEFAVKGVPTQRRDQILDGINKRTVEEWERRHILGQSEWEAGQIYGQSKRRPEQEGRDEIVPGRNTVPGSGHRIKKQPRRGNHSLNRRPTTRQNRPRRR